MEDFNALKPYMPSTDGYSFGFANYAEIRKRGFGRDEVVDAAKRMTASLRKDYPDRPAQFFPHAERLLDPANPQGIYAHLDRSKVKASRAPTDADLFRRAIAGACGELSRQAFELNEAIVGASDPGEKDRLRRKRRDWVDENRDALMEAWRARSGF